MRIAAQGQLRIVSGEGGQADVLGPKVEEIRQQQLRCIVIKYTRLRYTRDIKHSSA